jgi:hypothetical protein
MANITDLETLIGALVACGYNRNVIEVHAEPVNLIDWVGHNTHYLSGKASEPDKAHVVIRRNHTGISASNDIGFVRGLDGTYAAIVSEHEQRQLVIGGMKFVKAVEKQYTRLSIDRGLHHLLTNIIPGMQLSGEIPMESTVSIQDTDNEIRVLVGGA